VAEPVGGVQVVVADVQKAPPWNWFVPLLVAMETTAPGAKPNCAP